MPNTLDFDVVFKEFGRLDETGNVAVLSAIIVALLLYLLVVIFGRRADKRDKAKVKSKGFFSSVPVLQWLIYGTPISFWKSLALIREIEINKCLSRKYEKCALKITSLIFRRAIVLLRYFTLSYDPITSSSSCHQTIHV